MIKCKTGKIQTWSPSVKAFWFPSPISCLAFVPGEAFSSLCLLTGLGGQGSFCISPSYHNVRCWWGWLFFLKVYCFRSNLGSYNALCPAWACDFTTSLCSLSVLTSWPQPRLSSTLFPPADGQPPRLPTLPAIRWFLSTHFQHSCQLVASTSLSISSGLSAVKDSLRCWDRIGLSPPIFCPPVQSRPDLQDLPSCTYLGGDHAELFSYWISVCSLHYANLYTRGG